MAEVSTEADLEHSLSPSFPRAYLRHGQHGWAAIACPPDADASAVLSFGLIWLSYLRARERRVALEGLAIYLPAGEERSAALRVLCLDPQAARFELFTYTHEDTLQRVETARLRQSRHASGALPPSRAQHRGTLAADRRHPRCGEYSQT